MSDNHREWDSPGHPEGQDGLERQLSDEEIEAILAGELNGEAEHDGEADGGAEAPSGRRWIPRLVAALLAVAMLANVLAFWPQVYSLAAIQFLAKSRELAQNDEVQRYREAVVIVRADDRKGTGFAISADGLIVTNEHVVGDAGQVDVHFADGTYVRADHIASDAELDLALLQTVEGDDWPALAFDLERTVAAGEAVFVIGNPLFFNRIANEGVALAPVLPSGRERPVLALNAPIYKGNSGSPVIDQEGFVVAVVYATMRATVDGRSERVGLAVPISELAHLFPQPNPFVDR